MRLALAILVGRLVRIIARARGGGSAIPGRIAMLIEPRFLELTLGSLPQGVVFVSGSNGKSTTTALVSATLRSQGLRVFSNPSGGNMPQGIASAAIAVASIRGELSSDVAVLEVDEAYGEIIAKHVRPSWVVLTNIQIDQLNRFFEPDRVFEMLLAAAESATRGVVVNGSDVNLVALAQRLPSSLSCVQLLVSESALAKWPEGALAAPRFDAEQVPNTLRSTVKVMSEGEGVAEFAVGTDIAKVNLPGKGLHFAIDTGLALALGCELVDGFDLASASTAISKQETVYGRGEVANYRGAEISILMMKNPSSMRATLLAMDDPEAAVWIAMDDGTPDPSWIFDIDLIRIKEVFLVSGSRCWHWATRLSYAEIPVKKVISDSRAALDSYTDYLLGEGKRGTLLTNYEQMMEIRKQMGFLDLESGR